MRTSELIGEKKLRIFRNLWFVRTDKGILSQCGYFTDKERRHGRRQQGAGGPDPLNFQTWYKYST